MPQAATTKEPAGRQSQYAGSGRIPESVHTSHPTTGASRTLSAANAFPTKRPTRKAGLTREEHQNGRWHSAHVSWKRTLTLVLFVAYLSTVIVANWAVTTYGVVPVGFGLMAPAGVYVVGIAFTLRDLLHETGGRWLVLGAIAIGAVLSVLVATPALALASGVAFTVSELADLLVYEPLRRRGWLAAVAASNAAGLVVDSIVFLVIAFGSLQFLAGQVVGKAWMTLLAVAILAAGRALWKRSRSRDLRSEIPS